jgi:hypothetical protein
MVASTIWSLAIVFPNRMHGVPPVFGKLSTATRDCTSYSTLSSACMQRTHLVETGVVGAEVAAVEREVA